MCKRKIQRHYDNREISCFPEGNGDEEMTAYWPERGDDDRFQVNRPTAMPGHGLEADEG